MRILAVEDQPEVLDAVRQLLETEGHTVEIATSGEDALPLARGGGFTLYILDVGLPGMSGLELIARLRREGDTTPAIMLTAQSTEDAKVEGLDSGADDYVTKPFAVAELRARINALVRRVEIQGGTVRWVGDSKLDLEAHTVSWGDRDLRLTNREFGLLWALAEKPVRPRSREFLLERVWGITFEPETKVFDVHLSNLRRKLSTLDGPTIDFVAGEGYVFRG